MEIKVIASTKVGYELSKEEALESVKQIVSKWKIIEEI